MNLNTMSPLLAQATGIKTPNLGLIFVIFAVVWTLLMIGSFLFFHFNKNAVLKRKWFSLFVMSAGFIFIGFIIFIAGGDPRPLGIAVPVVVILSYLVIRNTKFCDDCGSTLFARQLWSSPKKCAHCQAPLK